MMATEHEEKNKARSWRNRISIIIAAVALTVSAVSGWVSYDIARESNEIAKRSLYMSAAKFRLSHYKSPKIRIEESISSIRDFSSIRDLQIIPSTLLDEVGDQEVGDQPEGQHRFYLWLIIENVANTATNLNLISIVYTFNHERQTLLNTVGTKDRRWPDLPPIIAPREAFVVLLHAFSNQSEWEGFDKFEVEFNYSIGKTGTEEYADTFCGKSTRLSW